MLASLTTSATNGRRARIGRSLSTHGNRRPSHEVVRERRILEQIVWIDVDQQDVTRSYAGGPGNVDRRSFAGGEVDGERRGL